MTMDADNNIIGNYDLFLGDMSKANFSFRRSKSVRKSMRRNKSVRKSRRRRSKSVRKSRNY